ncbi:hypothetical protein ACFQAS_03725 [Halopenitus salinus]|uniref:DUF7968 domain-containing protein n=1 Tax=Halopenitus salinus TaxID=1198295 RepID=A0ABD5UR46_9EURY
MGSTEPRNGEKQADGDGGKQADRVLLSFRSPEADQDGNDGWWVADDEWLAEGIREPIFRRYLRRAHAGAIAVGDEWEEFVSCGCASPEDVVLRVESVESGTEMGPETTIDVVPRATVVEDDVGTEAA